ncbi:AAA family ATPase [Siccibacter turicensis]
MKYKPGSAISRLINKAQNNDFYSAYQLYIYFNNGTYVDKDLIEAQKYFNLAKEIFKSQKFELNELVLSNYKIFNELTLKIKDKNLTVIVGNNGAGKTTLLESISLALSWVINRMLYKGGKGWEIDRNEITIGSDSGYASIISKFDLNKYIRANIELVSLTEGSTANKKSFLEDITKLGAFYKEMSSTDNFSYPLFAYYGVQRVIDISQRDITGLDALDVVSDNNALEGYANSLNGKSDFRNFFRWYKRLDDIEKHRTASIRSDEKVIDKETYQKLIELAKTNKDAEKLVKSLQLNDDRSPDYDRTYFIKKTINKVISSFMDGYTNLTVEVEPHLTLNINKNNQKINVLYLSQGEKSLLALVLDIARRLIILNPNLSNPLNGQGIILIDEFDLHLHPEWQRSAIKKLTTVFPNCQFIITTHSPQIISEVKSNQIIILEKDHLGRMSSFEPEQSYGLTSNEILNEIMLKNSKEKQLTRNKNVQEKLDEIDELISQKKTDAASRKIEDLKLELNGDIPELISARIDIEMLGWDD